MMKKAVKLENWYFTSINLTKKEGLLDEIKEKFSIDSLQLDLKPFITPGTLQSNVVKYLEINPYYEENMRELDSYENMSLILFSEFNLAKVDEKLQIVFEYID